MSSSRIITIILFSAIAVIALYFYIIKGGSLSETGLPIPTAPNEISVSPTPSESPHELILLHNGMHQITLQTNFGDITFATYDADAPNTVQNFIILAEKKFYNNLIFHRVIKGFMIQGGDPNGNGTGGPGYSFKDELNLASESYKQGYVKGVVAMANAGPDTNGSQFFIMLQDTPLPHNYTIFGKVISGQEVVDKVGDVKTNAADKPLEDIVIKTVIVNTL